MEEHAEIDRKIREYTQSAQIEEGNAFIPPNTENPEFLIYTAAPVVEWWGDKTLADAKKSTCAQ